MNFVDSLLDAIVRLQGDALVMHVGEKPYVVTTTSAMNEFRGPILWGQVELSSRVLTSQAVLGLLGQILPSDRRRTLDELGAVEHEIQASQTSDRFAVIAARGGDDVWVEVRPLPKVEVPAAVEQPVAADSAAAPEEMAAPQQTAAVPESEAPPEPEPEPVVAPAAVAETVEEHLQPPAEVPVEPAVASPVEEEPVHRAEASGVVDELLVVESPAAFDQPAEPEVSVDEPVQAIASATGEEQREEDSNADAPFEIVPEVNQDAPTDADVDELFAVSAAALLAAPAAKDPFDINVGEPRAAGEHYEPIGIAPELGSEWAPLIAESEPQVPLIAESEPQAAPVDPPALSAFTPAEAESNPVEEAPQTEPVQFLFDATESATAETGSESVTMAPELEPEWVAMVAATEPEPVAIEADAVPETEEIEHEAFAIAPEEFVAAIAGSELVPAAAEWQPEFVHAVAEFEPPSVIVAPERELVGAIAEAQTESAGIRWEAQPVSIIPNPEPERMSVRWEPESVPVGGDPDSESGLVEWEPEPLGFFAENDVEPVTIAAEPEHASLVEDREPEPVAVAAEPEPEPEAVAAAPAEPVSVLAETESQPAAVDPEPVAVAVEPDTLHADAPQQQPKPQSVDLIEPERAVILPLARRLIRHEPPSGGAHLPSGFSIDELLRVAAARGASTVYLVAQSRPMVRAEGDINVLDIGAGTALEESDIARLVLDLAPDTAREAWQRGASAEWICDVADVGRVRCMTFRDHRGPGLIFRMIPPQAISADQLGLTAEVQALCAQSDGLVLVTGPRASGKSTLMSAFVDLINRTRSDHLITIESQIGFVHESRRSFVSQREVRGNGESVVAAVRSALREDPDVLFINDLSSAEMASVALDAAESGRLVFASLPASSTVAAVDRLLELLPEHRRSHARASLAQSLRGVVAQVLVRRIRGGRSAAREVLLNTAAVAGLVQEAKTTQLTLAMESGRRHGMMPLNDALVAFVREGTVHVTEAYRKAFDKESFLAAMRREGVDTSFAEKLA